MDDREIDNAPYSIPIQISKHPLNLLINPNPARSGKPWEIDISDLLQMFISIAMKGDKVDLRLCGAAALSSAILYRFKVETLFYFERLRTARVPINRGEPPRMVILPFRYELYSTSIDDLVTSLERILQDVSTQAIRSRDKSNLMVADQTEEIDRFVVKIQGMVKEFRERLTQMLMATGVISFSKLINGMSLREKARYFILLFFVAHDGLVQLEQEEDDIRIIRVIDQEGSSLSVV